MSLDLHPGDALIVVDVQVDFVDGTLAIPGAHEVLPRINAYVEAFARAGLPIVYTRDWHPRGHVSFRHQGGPWPAHCVAGSHGAQFAATLQLVDGAYVVSKATNADADAYSAFDGTTLDGELRRLGVRRLFVCGLATDYCVLQTVKDARRLRYETFVLADAIRAVEPQAGERAQHEMLLAGAAFA
jgi:nicotinamidase/pyrazinamidase